VASRRDLREPEEPEQLSEPFSVSFISIIKITLKSIDICGYNGSCSGELVVLRVGDAVATHL
jgi:hypothetical protein